MHELIFKIIYLANELVLDGSFFRSLHACVLNSIHILSRNKIKECTTLKCIILYHMLHKIIVYI
jgi:hypothetical protein